VARPPLPDVHRARLAQLAGLLSMDTFTDVFSIVIKTHFRWDGGADFAWNTIVDLARASGDPAVLAHAEELRGYFTLARSDSPRDKEPQR
jgi:L-proline cis-4-hydroxylase